ncbi:MAG: GNAT family N-acetyltransferase [Methanosphaera sp.]|nr:GNAT family N-acetyltransferase [Methanosphaera sp.]
MIHFRTLEDYDDTQMIASWIYSTDKFLFNWLFYNDKIRSITAIERLFMSDYINPYHRNYMMIAYDDRTPREVLGVMLSFRGQDIPSITTYKAFKDTECTSLPLVIQNKILSEVFASQIGSNDYYIGNLYVDPKARNNHIGSKLVEKAKQRACQMNATRVILDVEYDKDYLLDFYAKRGFNVCSKNYHKILNKTYGCYGLEYKIK